MSDRRAQGARSGRVTITPERGLDLRGTQRLWVVVPLLWAWARRDTRARYRQSALRTSWTVIQPVVLLATYGWVFSVALDVESEALPYLSFAWAGLVPFTFLQQAFSTGAASLHVSGPLVSRMWFPREVIPLSAVVCALVELAVMTVLLVGVAWVQIGPPTVHVVSLVATDLVVVLWVGGTTMATAAIAVIRRDLLHAVPLLLRVAFIASPVMYSATVLGPFGSINPLSFAIEATRDATLHHRWPAGGEIAAHLAAASVAFLLGYRALRRREPRMADFL